MSTYLPAALLNGLRDGADLTARAGGRVWTIARLTERGFAVAADEIAPLPGLVDLYDGERHLLHCLVVRADGAPQSYEFKRATPAREAAPFDFAPPEAMGAADLGAAI